MRKAHRLWLMIVVAALLVRLCWVGAFADFSFEPGIAGEQFQNLADAESTLGLSGPDAPMSLRALLEQAQPTDVADDDGLYTASYPTSLVEEYLPENIHMIEVTVLGDNCYITYGFTGTHTLVYLVYSLAGNSIVTIAVRDMDADSRVTFTADEKKVEENVTKGNAPGFSDAIVKYGVPALVVVLMLAALAVWRKFHMHKTAG